MRQIGTDRIIELEFSEGQYRLFLEFYAGGNIVLTNKEFSIIALFRIVSEGPGQEELRVGSTYLLEGRQNYSGIPPLTSERVKAGLQKTLGDATGESVGPSIRLRKKPGDALRKALAGSLSEFPPVLLDHCLRVANFDAATPIELVVGNDEILQRLLLALQEAKRIYGNINKSESCKGYIIAKPQKGLQQEKQDGESKENPRGRLLYEDFQPFLARQFEDDHANEVLEFEGFNKAVDEFFSSVESQKLQSRLTEREEHARKKLETAKQDHEQRLGGLQQVQELNVRKAQAIEGNLQRVQEAIGAVNSLVAQSIGWAEIARLIEMEQQRKNPVAQMIELPLKLSENTVTLLLAEADFEGEGDFEGNETNSDVSDSEDEGTRPPKSRQPAKLLRRLLTVDVDLALSPWSNARQYYDQKKTAAVKEQRTLQSSDKALKSTERKINADLKKGLKQEKDVLRPQRRAMWFEKFIYFISSEGYLVIGGKDAQQEEMIYKKYLKKGDVYVHADLQGAASVIVKNKPGRSSDPLPPSTLSQAGTLAVCTSSAWDSKAVMSAWWVHADQVSKIGYNGEYLQPGSFTTKGQKNFLPPAQLLLGFGLMFKISEESKARHHKHRAQDSDDGPPRLMVGLDDTKEDAEDLAIAVQVGDTKEEGEDQDRAKSSDEEHGHEREQADEPTDRFEDEERSESVGENEPYYQNPLQPNDRQLTTSNEESPDTGNANLVSGDSEDESDPEADYTFEDDVALEKAERESSEIGNREVGTGVRHLSARERRLMRKGLQPNASENTPQVFTSAASLHDTPASSQAGRKQLNTIQVRGKKGKRNKLKTRYADQDEEDRTLAMRLLGSSSAQEKLKEDEIASASKEAELAAAKERRRKQHALAAEKGKEEEKRRLRVFDEDVKALDEDNLDEVVDLETFVGAPLPGDEILDALVVCGPWDAIGSRFRWRMKLQPGSLKKGKAVKEILGAWNAALGAWDKKKRAGSGDGNMNMVEEDKVRRREGELIRAIREPEIIGVIPVGKVRVMMGSVDGSSKAKGGGTAGKGRRGGKGSKRQ